MRLDVATNVGEAVGNITSSPKAPYIFSGLLATVSTATFNELVGAIGVLASIVIAFLTYRSNHKRNIAQIRAAEAQTKLAEANIQPVPSDKN